MPPTDDCTAKTAAVLVLFEALAEIRALENTILDALTRLTAPADLLPRPQAFPLFSTREGEHDAH